jgi:cytochrome c oxidase cbb3-type subunit 1
MFLQYGAVISTIAVELVVATVVINFMGTIWGDGRRAVTNLPIRWFYTGIVYYFITCLQCSFQVTLTFQKLIHFTDWVVGHAHLVMFGVFSMWIFGVMTYLFPRLLGVDWYSRRLCEWNYWLFAGGILLMATDLILGGIFQGWAWAAMFPWEESITISIPFWIVRVVAGLAMFLGLLCFLYNLFMTWRQAAKTSAVPKTGQHIHQVAAAAGA